jgi:thiol:disulfide interchange protein
LQSKPAAAPTPESAAATPTHADFKPAEQSGLEAGSAAEPQTQFVRSYAEGLRQSQASGKPMLVFFTAEWCRYCHQMADDAFGQEAVVLLSQQFVCVMVDADAEPDVCRQFRVQAFPTVQFVSTRGVPLNRLVGRKPGADVVAAMHAALQSVARRSVGADAGRR